jgi:hypothetical protein
MKTRQQIIDQVAQDFEDADRPRPVDLEGSRISFAESAAAIGVDEEVALRVRQIEIDWFAKHPDKSEMVRRLFPGEFPPDVTAHYVRVKKLDIAGRRRMREPVERDARHDRWVTWQGNKEVPR